MSYQAYINAVEAKTGKSIADLRKLAKQRGLLDDGIKASAVVAWLKSTFGLGHGHAMAAYDAIRAPLEPKKTIDERFEAHFSGRRASFKPAYAKLTEIVKTFGSDTSVNAGDTYISFLRNGRKFAIAKVGATFMDIGVKARGAIASARLRPSGTWNAMVTHRVRVLSDTEIDAEVTEWLRVAYADASSK
jgi:hypothetical protein